MSDKKIHKKIDKISEEMAKSYFQRYLTYKIAMRSVTGRLIYQDIRDMLA